MSDSIEHRGFLIKQTGAYGMSTIHRIGSGRLPPSLSGSFTEKSIAADRIDIYLSLQEGKDAKKPSSGRGS